MKEILEILLIDRTTNKNIIWANNTETHKATDEITFADIENIKPRRMKTQEEKSKRSKDKAEVFTPSWVCNKQNNLVDNEFLKQKDLFNKETEKGWETNYNKIVFPDGMTWQDYISSTRLEITCGEAPYLTSRYDTVTGKYIEPKDRIGFLDRKLRVITENIDDKYGWLLYTMKALHNIYGYDFQGDNVYLARVNLLNAVIEYYESVFNTHIMKESIPAFAEIISYNIWQMDGLKGVVPFSCSEECKACKCKSADILKNIKKHDGIYAKIMDWNEYKAIRFVDMMKE